jgi:hypothetical protein
MKYYVTFGSQYRRRGQHPLFPPAHHDGYVVVEAEDYGEAEKLAHMALGDDYEMIYAEQIAFKVAFYPRGELGRIDSKGQITASLPQGRPLGPPDNLREIKRSCATCGHLVVSSIGTFFCERPYGPDQDNDNDFAPSRWVCAGWLAGGPKKRVG